LEQEEAKLPQIGVRDFEAHKVASWIALRGSPTQRQKIMF
jgi:hypothetical protein